MKYNPSRNRFLPAILLLLFAGLFASCEKKWPHSNFYYSGDEQIEIIIPGDTLAILFTNPPTDTSLRFDASFNKLKKLADTSLSKQGYKPAGYMTDNIKFLTGPKKKKSISLLENEARQLKDSNKAFIAYAGYLARIKESGEPIIITDQINIAFKPGTTDAQINNLFQEYHLAVVQKNPFTQLKYTVAVTAQSQYHALKMSQKLKQKPIIVFSYIDIIYKKRFDAVIPVDTYFTRQWNLLNTGINSDATEDADIDAELAWDYTMGSENNIIAIIDEGFDMLHLDMAGSFSSNRNETPGDRIDNDDNDGNPLSFIDDVIGWNFIPDEENPFGSNNLTGGPHGTPVMGIVAADKNDFGICGVCPGCSLLPLRTAEGAPESLDVLAIDYARYRGAKIINLSWHPNAILPTLLAAIGDPINKEILFICSMNNEKGNSCQPFHFTSLPNTIAVSRSNRFDKFDNSGQGDCLDLLAPSSKQRDSNEDPYAITTIDETGNAGKSYGTTDWNFDAIIPDPDYTASFWGTSASVPQVAGVAGLLLSADASLTREQVQYLLQDCADKIDPTAANYSKIDGKSMAGTHSYGRINAFEAVRIAAPVTNGENKGGLGGMDIFLRDNALDWGNTEQPSNIKFESPRQTISWWRSMDIKVDGFPFQNPTAAVNNKEFEEEVDDENIAGGALNRIYVRVRNRGYKTIPSASAIVKLHLTDACLSFPPLPSDFWDSFPANASDVSVWQPIGTKPITDLRYSGSSVAGRLDDDGSQIIVFEFTAPVHDPTKPKNHYCLMALVSCDNDPMPKPELRPASTQLTNAEKLNMDYVTTHYNNATHRNYSIENSEQPFTGEFILYNPYPYPIITKIETESGKKINVTFGDSLITKELLMKKGEKKVVTIRINPEKNSGTQEVTIKQILIDKKQKGGQKIMGGMTYIFRPPKNSKK